MKWGLVLLPAPALYPSLAFKSRPKYPINILRDVWKPKRRRLNAIFGQAIPKGLLTDSGRHYYM